MTALIIICAVILFFAFLMKCSIRAELKYLNEVLDFKVKYLFFTVFPLKKKERKAKKSRSKKKKGGNESSEESIGTKDAAGLTESEAAADVTEAAETASDCAEDIASEEKGDKNVKASGKFDDIIIKIKQAQIIWKSVKNALTKLFKGIHINNLMIDFKIGGEDACEAAVNYGKISAVVYNVISLVRIWFPITVKTVDISCDFNSKKSIYDVELSVNLGLGTAIAVLFTAFWGYIKNKNELDSAGNGEVNSDKDSTVLNAV